MILLNGVRPMTMLTEKIKALKGLQIRAAELQKVVEAERTEELATLPSAYGYASVNEFIRALRRASGYRAPGRPRAARGEMANGKRTRTKITDAVKQRLAEMVRDGKTNAQIAKALRISSASVHNVKTELGLTRPRRPKEIQP